MSQSYRVIGLAKLLEHVSLLKFMVLWLVGGMVSLAPVADVSAETSATTALARAALPRGALKDFGPPPSFSNSQEIDADLHQAVETAFGDVLNAGWGSDQREALSTIAESGDARYAWIVADLMRFASDPGLARQLTRAANKLLDTRLRGLDAWHEATERLMAWDIPAPPEYLRYKRQIFTAVLRQWQPLMQPGEIDWRHVSWGGVGIDDRPFGQTDLACSCIPAADDPEVTSAEEAWLKDDDVVFGISINGEHRAYPRRIMEVREMVNDTLGGRDLGIPYCTLCGAAQAWYTDQLPDGIARPVLRTSGLLSRSNKVMFDLNTFSVFDTFKGHAVTGPLAEQGIRLKSASVVTTTWGDWKATHPDTTVLVEELALGRDFDFRNNRDADGPIFPIGQVDPRLPVHEDILGVILPAGEPLAFHVQSLIDALDAGDTVEVDGIRVVLEARGVRAVDESGRDLGTHQAFWFAWSQFYPTTRLWPE